MFRLINTGRLVAAIERKSWELSFSAPLAKICHPTGWLAFHFWKMVPPADDKLFQYDNIEARSCPGYRTVRKAPLDSCAWRTSHGYDRLQSRGQIRNQSIALALIRGRIKKGPVFVPRSEENRGVVWNGDQAEATGLNDREQLANQFQPEET